MKENSKEKRECINGLRELADFLEQSKEFPSLCPTSFYVFAHEAEEISRLGRLLGPATKESDIAYFNITRYFGPHKLQVTGKHAQVCEAKVIGKKIVTRKVPIEFREETVEEEVIEWKCPQILGGKGNEN